LPEEFKARMEPPDVPTNDKPEKCAGVTAPSVRLATYVHTSVPEVMFMVITVFPAVM